MLDLFSASRRAFVAGLAALALVAGTSGRLSSHNRLDSAASRETVFLLNNLLLTAFMFTVLLGTLFPLVAEAVIHPRYGILTPFLAAAAVNRSTGQPDKHPVTCIAC